MIKAIITFIATLSIELLVICYTNTDFGWLVGIPVVGGLIVYFNQKN